MSLSRLSSGDAWIMELATPAEVVNGEVIITGDNLPVPSAGAVGSTAIANQSGVAGDTVSDALDQVSSDAAAAQVVADSAQADATDALKSTSIYAPISNIISASAEFGAVDVYAGTITRLSVIPTATIATGNLTVTFYINGVGITGGVVTVTNGAAAGTLHVATPSGANVAAEHAVLAWEIGGGNTTAGRASIRITIDTTTP